MSEVPKREESLWRVGESTRVVQVSKLQQSSIASASRLERNSGCRLSD
jgi:hypothetical protein